MAAPGLAEYIPFESVPEPDTAPPSADFSSSRSMHFKPVVFENGLVDPGSVFEYMDGCHCADLEFPCSPGSHHEEGHHMYFRRSDFKNQWAPLPIRRLRNARTNHIMMLNCQEDLYHQDTEETVPHEGIDIAAAEAFLEEDEALTRYASAMWISTDLREKLNRPGRSRSEVANLSARLALVQEMTAEGLVKVNSIELIDFRVVTGALQRYNRQKPNKDLAVVIEGRVQQQPDQIPIRIYDDHALRDVAKQQLDRKIKTQQWAVRRILAQPILEAA